MRLRDTSKNFFILLLKSLNPKYYQDLGEKDIKSAIKYFLALLLFSFIIMSIISIPKLMLIKSDLEKDTLQISKLDIEAKLETSGPILIPNGRPVISLDTTGNRTLDTEAILITDDTVHYRLFGKEYETKMGKYEFTEDKTVASKLIIKIVLFIMPSILTFYYIIYLLKYLLIIIPISFLASVFAKIVKNKVKFKQAISLSIYTSTIMVLLEILAIPFFIKDYLITYSPFIGLYFSIIAITAYLTFFVTAIRINGNKNLIN